ncbi:CSS-motif domain-containing protein [Pseudomonas akapageensis]|uniref:CSS-motif domain-containing protein n=1 Tax=Pseudomonas akapageensis TaxID=2609961 RepID=UPI00140799D3|nr:CSS-motif domain-containing protein [Pseudomonas akapageensis]
MNWQLAKQLDNDAMNATKHALGAIEELIRPIADANQALMSVAGQACINVVARLREHAISEKNLRSVLLISDNNVYCSSLYGEMNAPLNPGEFHNRTFWLRPGNEATPDRAVLYYRTYEHPYGVASLIDGSVLRSELALLKTDATLTLEFGSRYLDSDGSVHGKHSEDQGEFYHRLVSTEFGFAVNGGYPDGTRWKVFTARAATTTASLLLVGLVTGIAVFWLTGRSQLRRRVPMEENSDT